MKKSLLLSLLLAIVGIMATGCSSCQSENKKQETESVEPVKTIVLTPENAIGCDRQTMYLRTPVGADLHWMQTGIVLTSFLTDESVTDATVMEVTNGFQTQIPNSKGVQTKVTLITTNTMTTDSLVLDGSFWFDNYPLESKAIKLTFSEAIDRIIEANCPKPQTRCIVLRCPVGPVHIDDAYYIAGDGTPGTPMVFVNANTGEVFTENPAFNINNQNN